MTSIIKGNLMQTIKMDDIDKDDGKGQWIDLDDDDIIGMFSDLIVNSVESNDEIPSEFRFDRTRDAEFYAERFPGFSQEAYQILEDEQRKINEILSKKTHAYERRGDSASEMEYLN